MNVNRQIWRYILGAIIAVIAIEAQTRQEYAAYVVGPGDVLSIWALGAEEISDKPTRVDPQGYLDLPLLGRLPVAGKALIDVRALLVSKLTPYVKQPEVAVSVVEFRSQPVSVVGEVNTPGLLQLQGRKSLLEVISMAGGLKPDAGYVVNLSRRKDQGDLHLPASSKRDAGDHVVAEISLKRLIDGQDPSLNVDVRPYDVISVPKAQLFYVMGEVRKPGGFILSGKKEIPLLEALSLAEGMTNFARGSKARILRRKDDGSEREELTLNLGHVLNGKSSEMSLRADDILFVPSNGPKKVGIRAAEAAISLGTGVLIWR